MSKKFFRYTQCLIALISISQLFSECALAPKYRSKPYARGKTAGEFTIPDELVNAQPLYTEIGTASWYGPQFHGKYTANGEVFDMNEISAAHKEFPLGTWMRVTNLKNDRQIYVRVNDRGPFVEGRILDLSRKAAEELDFITDGLTEVKIEVLQWGNGK